MKYLLDTNSCVYLLNGNEMLKLKVKEIGIYSLSLANCVLAELYFGAFNSKNVEKNLERIERFKTNLMIVSDSDNSARLFGQIKADLKAKGKILDDFDILIASIAIANNFILVTNNTGHFKRIDKLQVENWTKDMPEII